jgi:light-regulated signal transduction histidine kinase (bacteriophytochrome)
MVKEKESYEERIIQLEMELQIAINREDQYKKDQEEFIYLASHELQAPLRKLSIFVERLTDKFKDPAGKDTKTYIERIQSTLAGMRNIINNVTALSEINSSGPDFQKCDLNEVLQIALQEIQPSVPEHKEVVTFPFLPVIEGNYDQLKDLFKRLLHNSFKFYKKNADLEIKIDSKQVNREERKAFGLPGNRNYFKIEITDNGIGFDEKYSERIFQPFQRLHGKSDYEGDGFGLAICKKIVEKHNGIIFASSTKEPGTRFTFILPEAHN